MLVSLSNDPVTKVERFFYFFLSELSLLKALKGDPSGIFIQYIVLTTNFMQIAGNNANKPSRLDSLHERSPLHCAKVWFLIYLLDYKLTFLQ